MNTEILPVKEDNARNNKPVVLLNGKPTFQYVSDKAFIDTFNKITYNKDKPVSGVVTKFLSSVAGLFDADNNVVMQTDISIPDSKMICADNQWLNEYRWVNQRHIVIEASECQTVESIRSWAMKKLPKVNLSEARFFVGSRLTIVWTPAGSFFAIPLNAEGNCACGMQVIRDYTFLPINYFSHIPSFSPVIGFNFMTAAPVIKGEVTAATGREIVESLKINEYPYGIIKVISETASEMEVARLFVDISEEDERRVREFAPVIDDSDFIKTRLDYYLYPVNLYNEQEALEFRFPVRTLRLARVIRTPSTEPNGLTTITFVSDTGHEYSFRCISGLEEALLQSSVI